MVNMVNMSSPRRFLHQAGVVSAEKHESRGPVAQITVGTASSAAIGHGSAGHL